MLEMKSSCLACEAKLAKDASAVICSYECTYCPECALGLNHVCKNCGGELVPRPKRHVIDVGDSAGS